MSPIRPALALAVFALSANAATVPLAATGPYHVDFAVYHPKAAPDLAALRKLPELADFALDGSGEAKPGLAIRSVTPEKWPSPTAQDVEYSRGLTPADKTAAMKSVGATVFQLRVRRDQALPALKAVQVLVSKWAKQTGGFIWDDHSQELFSPGAFDERRIVKWKGAAPSVEDQIGVRADSEADGVSLLTVGMGKFGLPDLAFGPIVPSNSRSAVSLLNVVAQILVERNGQVSEGELLAVARDRVQNERIRSSLKSDASFSLKLIKSTERSPSTGGPMVHVRAPSGDAGTILSDSLLDAAFGSAQEHTHHRTDEQVLAACAPDRPQLPIVKARFQKGLHPFESLQLKARFRGKDGGIEWMWISVLQWKGQTIDGLLRNQPSIVTQLKESQKVSVAEADLCTYLITNLDGGTEGNSQVR